MGLRRAAFTTIIVAAVLAGCGGRADAPATTIPDGQGEFSARQTQIAQQNVATMAAEPTVTRTATPEPSPTMTALPTITPGGAMREPDSTAKGTPEPVVGVRVTETPAATAAPKAGAIIINTCGPEPLEIEVQSDPYDALIDWYWITTAYPAILSAWQELFALVEGLVLFEQVADNTAIFDGATGFEEAVGEHLPVLEEIEDDSPFYDLAQTIVGRTEDQITFAQLLTRAGTEQDMAAWDEARAISATFPDQAETVDDFHNEACEYLEAQQ